MSGKQATTQAGKDGGPIADRADAIRNVALVGPAGSGKTTLVETLLVSAGVLNRAGSTAEGTTVSDFDDAEHSVTDAEFTLTREDDGNTVNTDACSAADATRRTSASVRMRYWIRSAIVIISSLCFFANFASSGTRAMLPSSFMISQMTPAG